MSNHPATPSRLRRPHVPSFGVAAAALAAVAVILVEARRSARARIAAVAVALTSALVAWRIAQMGARVEADGVTVVGFTRSTHTAWEGIDRFDVLPWRRRPFVAHLVRTDQGPPIPIAPLAVGRRADEREVRAAVDRLNVLLDARRDAPPPASAPPARGEPLVLHPAVNVVARGAGAAVVWVGAAVALAVSFQGTIVLWLLLGCVLCGAGTVAYVRAWSRRATLTIADGAIVYSGLWRQRLVTHGGPVVRMVRVEVSSPRSRRTPLLLLVDAHGRSVLNVDPAAWEEGDLRRLRDALGVEPEALPQPMSRDELRRAFPGALPRRRRAPSV